VIFRPHNVYGERQNIGDRYRNVIGIHMNQLMRGEPLTIFGDGNQRRAFSYVGDVAPIIARAPDVPAARNRVFNIGADKPYSVNELASVVMRKMGIDGKLNYLPARREVVDAFADHSLVREVFGEHRVTPLEEGISRMAQWAKSVGSRESNIFADVEVTRNMPENWRSVMRKQVQGEDISYNSSKE